MRPSPTSGATATHTPKRPRPRTAPPSSASCSASTAPSCCITRPPSSPTAASSAWVRRSASPPTVFTPADRSGSSNSPATSTSCAARDRCGHEGAPRSCARRASVLVRVLDGGRSRGSLGGGGGAALAVHPARVPAQVVLLLPDRHALLDLVDDVAAGEKRLVAMRCAHTHPHRQLPDRQLPDAVQTGGVRHAKARARLGENALTFAHGERLEGLVLQAPHAPALVGIAHPAFERRVAAAGGVGELRARRLWLDGRAGEAEHGLRGRVLNHRRPAE